MKISYLNDVQFRYYGDKIKTNQFRYIQKQAILTFLSTNASVFIHFDV